MKKYLEYINESISKDELYKNMMSFVYRDNYTKIKEVIDSGLINFKDKYDYTMLIYAAEDGREKTVKMLLENPDINVNITGSFGDTAIMRACENKYVNVVKMVLVHPKIDLTIKNLDGQTFFDFGFNYNTLKDYDLQIKILSNGREDIIDLLDEHELAIPGIKENPEVAIKTYNWGLTGL